MKEDKTSLLRRLNQKFVLKVLKNNIYIIKLNELSKIKENIININIMIKYNIIKKNIKFVKIILGKMSYNINNKIINDNNIKLSNGVKKQLNYMVEKLNKYNIINLFINKYFFLFKKILFLIFCIILFRIGVFYCNSWY
ncbi:hypothetical protein [Candidatus Nardonella dryophthoridicola]|uniref:Uncharacterized protein n=1 Tax=endosymbiont of Metamasius hemipterus TaxID=204627 RepID=A0ABT0TXF3_9GAMM|nr:hypothetical protein [Candidatus Nardonella dryophthoridicola]MCM0158247.1 hypothetical protein [endosymbiont of Metamasius hemipterus]